MIASGPTVNTMGHEVLEPQAKNHHGNFERIVDSASQNQFMGSNTDDKVRNAVDNIIIAVENLMHDAIITAMNYVVIPRVEMAVRSITGASGNEPSNIFQKPDRSDFAGNTKTTPLKSASSRLDSKIEQDEVDDTHDFGNSEDDDFPATTFDHDL